MNLPCQLSNLTEVGINTDFVVMWEIMGHTLILTLSTGRELSFSLTNPANKLLRRRYFKEVSHELQSA